MFPLCRKLKSIRNLYIMTHFIRYDFLILTVCRNFSCFRGLTSKLLRWCGVKVGKRVFVAQGVYFDAHPDAIEIGDDVLIAPNVQILTHKRDLSGFSFGMKYNEVDHVVKPVKLCSNCFVGMGAIIMPGVTVGEGGGVASGAVVTKDVPPHTIVAGNPAKPIREYFPDGTSVNPSRNRINSGSKKSSSQA